MIDFILAIFVVAVFYAGFWCGNRFGTIKMMAKEAWAKIDGLMK